MGGSSHCVEKHSEIPPEQRTYKGSVVFEGSFVSDQISNVVVFEELPSSASLILAPKVLGVLGSQRDDQQAYKQSELKGIGAWIFPPERPVAKGMGDQV